jgi:hypothetical protein
VRRRVSTFYRLFPPFPGSNSPEIPQLLHGWKVASIYKTPEGTWRVQVAKRGKRLSGTFSTKKAAEMWAVAKESEILKGTYQGAGARTVTDLFDEYAKRVSDGKQGGAWERVRFTQFKREFPELGPSPDASRCGLLLLP